MHGNRRRTWLSIAGLCMFLMGCQSEPRQQAGLQQHPGPRQQYDLRGKVVGIDKDRRQVIIAHEKIDGYMDAMTMPFNVKDDWAMSVLAPGQEVQATLVVQGNRSWIEGIVISGGAASANPVSTSAPEPGAGIPDFELVNQDGKTIHISQYRGQPLLLTFIYTRCPLPDFCPLMSSNFAAIHRKLQTAPPSDQTPHLLSISIDYDYDTPPVLRRYAQRYMNPADFRHWEFAAGSSVQIRKITDYFGLSFRKESDQIVHSLVTALIGSDGRLIRLYHGNEWKPEEVLANLN